MVDFEVIWPEVVVSAVVPDGLTDKVVDQGVIIFRSEALEKGSRKGCPWRGLDKVLLPPASYHSSFLKFKEMMATFERGIKTLLL